jgi:hypothetical protein
MIHGVGRLIIPGGGGPLHQDNNKVREPFTKLEVLLTEDICPAEESNADLGC